MLFFYQKALPATQSATLLNVAGYDDEQVYHAADGAYFTHLHVICTDRVVSGSIQVDLYKNNDAVLSTAVALGAGEQREAASISMPISPGNRVTAKATTTSLNPADSADLLVAVS